MIDFNIDAFCTNFMNYKKLDENKYQLFTDVRFLNGKKYETYLVSEGSRFYLVDNKCTIKYLNELYELKSNDVKSCVSGILKIYNVKIIAGELVMEIQDLKKLSNRYCDFLMCISQLANMFVFFDKPE